MTKLKQRARTNGDGPAVRHGRAPPEVDDTQLDSFVGYNLRRAAAKQRERFRSVFERYDIRPVQLTVLTLLNDNASMRQAALGKALEIKRANVVTLLAELEQRGLIERRLSSTDRRSYVVELTEHGLELTRELLTLHAKLEADLARALGRTELKSLVTALRAFRGVDSKPKLR
jgi:DNA-binding MarR family transcriptional regulator